MAGNESAYGEVTMRLIAVALVCATLLSGCFFGSNPYAGYSQSMGTYVANANVNALCISPKLRFASSTCLWASSSASRFPPFLATMTARRAFISAFTSRALSCRPISGLLRRPSFPFTTN